MDTGTLAVWMGAVSSVLYFLGFLSAISAVMYTRTSQGAIAWSIALITFPYAAVPLYWVFGRRRFKGYVEARRAVDQEIRRLVPHFDAEREPVTLSESLERYRMLEKINVTTITDANRVELLIDGERAFPEIFRHIRNAEKYVLIQFFIVRDDALGNRLLQLLLEKARDGVDIYFLFDEIGCISLTRRYIDALREGGVRVSGFKTTRGPRNKFQINFRNHRKVLVVDGRIGFVGGLNIGDEYNGVSKKFGRWRDTHAAVTGPSVQALQYSFMEDWYWATRTFPDVEWTPAPAPRGDQKTLVFPSSPADDVESCSLMYVHCIHSAERRVWIASPYFVPDERVIAALKLAAIRGVDVRIMLPEKPDHLLVYLSSFSYIADVALSGVRFFRYQAGFMHQKVMLIDDEVSSIGTANLDNRSFRLNFEITLLVLDTPFAGEVEAMFEKDFECCREVTAADYFDRPLWFQFAAQLARLTAPVQ